MDPKQQTGKSINPATQKKPSVRAGSMGAPTAQGGPQDIKTSLEQQRQVNRQKFEDPFYIKVNSTTPITGEDRPNSIINPQLITGGVHIARATGKEDDSSMFSEEDKSQQNKDANDRSRTGVNLSKPSGKNNNAEVEGQNKPRLSAAAAGGRSPVKDNKQNTDGNFNSQSQEAMAKVSSNKTLPQLVQVDLNLDSLRTYLEDIQDAINQHANTLNGIQGDLLKKANEKTVGYYFQKISEGLYKECGERPHSFRLDNEQNFLAEHFQTEDSTNLKRQADRMTEKFEVIGLNIINYLKYRTDTSDRLDRLEKMLPKCFTVDQFRDESQKMEERTFKYINDRLGDFQENLNQNRAELNEALASFGQKTDDIQSETLWRIKDCEELLKVRVSDKYVNDALKSVEEKIMKFLNAGDEKVVERQAKAYKELGQIVNSNKTMLEEKLADMRKVMSTYDLRIANLATMDRVITIQTGYKDMKYNLERELEMIQDYVKQVQDKNGEVVRRMANLEQALTGGAPIESQPIVGGGMGQASGQGSIGEGSAIGSGRGDNKSVGSIMNRNRSPEAASKGLPLIQRSPMLKRGGTRAEAGAVQELQNQMYQFEDVVLQLESRIDTIKKVLEDKVSRDDIPKLTSDKVSKDDIEQLIPNEEMMHEKMKFIIRDEIENIHNKFTSDLKRFDDKFVRITQAIDVHSINKQIEKKANKESVSNDFGNHEFKISTLDRNIIRMAQDFETFQLAFNKMHAAIMELQEANRDVLLGKRTSNCLSCGKGNENNNAQVFGRDGKVYKGTMAEHIRNSNLGYADSDGIGQQQYMPYDGQSPLGGTGGNHQNVSGYQIQNPLNTNMSEINLQNQQQMLNENANYLYLAQAMKASNSFYNDNEVQAATFPNLHGTQRKTASIVQGSTKNLPSNIGIIQPSQLTGGLHTSTSGGQHMMTPNLQAPTTSFSTNLQHQSVSRKKLPFGFQVQKEKRDLFKLEGQSRGKSSHASVRQAAITNRINMLENDLLSNQARPESGKMLNAAFREEKRKNMNNTTYDIV